MKTTPWREIKARRKAKKGQYTMTSRDFCYWLQGYLELDELAEERHDDEPEPTLTAEQLECIRRHLALVFKHEIDPSYGPPEKQAELNKLHGDSSPAVKYDQSHVNEAPHPHDPGKVLYRC